MSRVQTNDDLERDWIARGAECTGSPWLTGMATKDPDHPGWCTAVLAATDAVLRPRPTRVVAHLNAYRSAEALMDAASLALSTESALVSLAAGRFAGQYFATFDVPARIDPQVFEDHATQRRMTILDENNEAIPTVPLWTATEAITLHRNDG